MFRENDGLVPRDRFVSAMRTVASSVTVVTTDGTAGRFGATVSAFSSVSADPPTVLVCLYADSRIARAVTENGRFCVNVLSENSPEIADRFAGRHDARFSDRFSGIECYGEAGTAPMIDGATCFGCDVQQHVRSGSHLIVIGHVKEVWDGQMPPLAYRVGSYHRVVPQAATCAAE
ncbi:p-hydroxyphenylacetate 3-hydroxylase, reductase component [Roseovarius litorisediminis]|uniref:p-hydroxyphenylacetate 3-hydroxylase, reductase component n=1 Tax=Roseovarius litorisediminis TaxID=1312363 RepID=A0A1Y5T7K2_9RHOB|nr:flavin reductase family protein [Roseovarius litorisediminis]SLN54301.1 p-hydroxyphenylacetate 3-hydroxylase, reductase component [Roseovarius litorisediminis]